MEIQVSIGEIVDKFTILRIKTEQIKDAAKLNNVNNEYSYLKQIVDKLNISSDLVNTLYDINKNLWVIEDKIREHERMGIFDSEFIELARMVYKTNDKRAIVKKDINNAYKSEFVEEKSYEQY